LRVTLELRTLVHGQWHKGGKENKHDALTGNSEPEWRQIVSTTFRHRRLAFDCYATFPDRFEKGVNDMNLLLTGQHVEVSPALRAYVEEKLDRVIRHFDQIIDVAVVLGVEKPSEKDKRQRAEVNLRVKGNVFHLDHYAENLYAAIDGLVDRLDRQVLKHKGKIQDHQHEALKHLGDETLGSEVEG
jgi:putative sigma-54 modulation protein